jgi:hypothetical protein
MGTWKGWLPWVLVVALLAALAVAWRALGECRSAGKAAEAAARQCQETLQGATKRLEECEAVQQGQGRLLECADSLPEFKARCVKEPVPGPIIILNPQPDENGSHFDIDYQPTIDGSPTGCTLNPIAFGNVHLLRVVYDAGGQIVIKNLQSFEAKFAGKELTVARSSGNPAQLEWSFDCGAVSEGTTTEYPSTYSWHPDLRESMDSGSLRFTFPPGEAPPAGGVVARVEIQRSR